MGMLHTVNKSPFERNTLESCISLAKSGSSVLLIEDGVIGAMKGTVHSQKIADAMECPIGTVRSRIFRAREAIDKVIKPLMD